MATPDLTRTTLNRDPADRFQSLRRELGVTAFGVNLIALQPGQRNRIHIHERQEEVYLVLESELTLITPDGEQVLHPDEIARVAPGLRRQLVNAGPGRLVLLALGAAGQHEGRDALAFNTFEDPDPGRPPQEVPLPPDLPA